MKVFAKLALLLGIIPAAAQGSDISVQGYEVPKYPAIARVARVEGDVVVNLKVAANGDALEAKVASGPPMLRQASLDAVKKWRFYCASCKYGEGFEHRITLSFRIDPKLSQGDKTIEFKLPDRIVLSVSAPIIDTQHSYVAAMM
jgi:TonB family protein